MREVTPPPVALFQTGNRFSAVRAAVLDLGAGSLVLGLLMPLALTSGGYWPTAWGWGALVTLWATALTLVVARDVRVSPLGLATVTALLAFAGWMLLSSWWSWSVTASVRESERALLYVAAIAALLVLAKEAASQQHMLGALVLAMLVACGYGLSTRLFPDRLGIVDLLAGNRLAEPLGYWNALGVFAVVGLLVALALTDGTSGYGYGALGAAVLPILLATVYFTFSRGAWLALAAGLSAAIMISPRRLRLLTTLLFVAPLPALGVFLAYRSDALTQVHTTFSGAADEGRRLAVILLLLAFANGGLWIVRVAIERRLTVLSPLRLGYGTAVAALCGGVLAAVVASYGGPATLTRDAWRDFSGPPPTVETSLNDRLFSLSSNGRISQWKVAWKAFEHHRVVGTGAGTYEQSWLLQRPTTSTVRDAHSLYAETLAELGLVGLLLLGAALAMPLAAALLARSNPLVPAILGAYVAYLVHAGVDWDWEMPAVTLGGLFCGGVLLLAGRSRRELVLSSRARWSAAALALVLGAPAFVGLRGNVALAESIHAFRTSNFADAAADAREAHRWAPWSSEPWQRLGQAELARGDLLAARRAFLEGIEKDRRNWELWIGLASASTGTERARALREVARLNPQTSRGTG
jgi:hypothetical protein